jgi:hypothetical protein
VGDRVAALATPGDQPLGDRPVRLGADRGQRGAQVAQREIDVDEVVVDELAMPAVVHLRQIVASKEGVGRLGKQFVAGVEALAHHRVDELGHRLHQVMRLLRLARGLESRAWDDHRGEAADAHRGLGSGCGRDDRGLALAEHGNSAYEISLHA